MLATLFVLGSKNTQVCRLHGKRPSATRENLFSDHKSSERAKFRCQQPRSTYKTDRRASGFRGCQVARDLARRIAPIVQGKSGSSDPVETGGSQSAYQGSVFRETRSLPFFTAEIANRGNAESNFGAKPTVLALGHIKRAYKWGQPPFYNNEYYLGRSFEGRAAHIRVTSAFGSSRGKRTSSLHPRNLESRNAENAQN
jgi:hypothetical protein